MSNEMESANDAYTGGSSALSTLGGVASLASGNPLFSLGASVIGGLFGSSSAKSANRQAQQNAMEQMAWQERMSSTAHQREVADLRAAGLNPILSVNRSGASSPQGTSAPVINEGAAALSSALQTQRQHAELELITAQTEKTRAEAANVRETAGQPTEQTNTLVTQQGVNSSLQGLNKALAGSARALEQLNKLNAEMVDTDLEHFREKDLQKLNLEIGILSERIKTERRIGKLNATAYAEAMGELKMLSDALPGIRIKSGSIGH